MFWLLLVVYFIGLLIFVGLLQAFNENKDNMELVFCIVMLGFALALHWFCLVPICGILFIR